MRGLQIHNSVSVPRWTDEMLSRVTRVTLGYLIGISYRNPWTRVNNKCTYSHPVIGCLQDILGEDKPHKHDWITVSCVTCSYNRCASSWIFRLCYPIPYPDKWDIRLYTMNMMYMMKTGQIPGMAQLSKPDHQDVEFWMENSCQAEEMYPRAAQGLCLASVTLDTLCHVGRLFFLLLVVVYTVSKPLLF